MLKILALMCDEQNHPLQSYLKKQPGRINSVNIVGSVVELLNYIHRMYENGKLPMPPRWVYLSEYGFLLEYVMPLFARDFCITSLDSI